MEGLLSHIHPITVHFPIAILIVAFLAETTHKFFKQSYFIDKFSFYLQMIGAVTFLLAIFTGLVFTEEHTGQAGAIGELHEMYGFIALGVILSGASLKYYIVQNQIDDNKYLNLSYFISFLGVVAIAVSSFLGGTLVYNYLIH